MAEQGVADKAQNLGDEAQEKTTDATEQAGGQASDAAGKATGTLGSTVGSLARKELVLPLAATAATAAAVYAAKKTNVVAKAGNTGTEKAGEALGKVGRKGLKDAVDGNGGTTGIAGSLLSKAIPGMGGGGGGGKGKTRRLQIQRWTDVAAPRETVYETWTNYEEYPKFMHRVLSVEREEEDNGDENAGENGEITWQEKIWFSKRQWKAEITEERENELIAWKTVSGTGHTGVVTFHELDDNLTRVMVTMDFTPSGMIEKMASGLRFVKRAVQADLARFKTKVEYDVAGLSEEREKRQEEGAPGTEAKKPGKDEKKDEEKDEDQPRAEAGGEDDQDDRDREAERREREERRESRRETVSA
jgi:uncharacterized membrane protein